MDSARRLYRSTRQKPLNVPDLFKPRAMTIPLMGPRIYYRLRHKIHAGAQRFSAGPHCARTEIRHSSTPPFLAMAYPRLRPPAGLVGIRTPLYASSDTHRPGDRDGFGPARSDIAAAADSARVS
jgi:hypothetical protein